MPKYLIQDALRFLPDRPLTDPAGSVRSILRGVLSPGFQAIVVYRIFRQAHLQGIPTQPVRYVAERLTEITTGISIPVQAEFGPGLRIHHFGGIIIHPTVKVGARCTLYHDVTLGADGLTEAAPTLGNDVMIGTGARVLGGISLGDGCRVGANAVVTRSFGPGAVLVGAPAKDIRVKSPG